MIDMSGSEGREPIEDYKVINQELAAYEQRLEDRPQIVVANKMDLPESQDNLILFKEEIGEDVPVIPVSTITRDNIDQLLYAIADKLEDIKMLTSQLKKRSRLALTEYYINIHRHKINLQFQEMMMVLMW
ncbi:GTP-binding protein CgtA [Staphylococcus aureus]|nr:GTP-binding protein CgtA [Staphylococcus aureus]